MPACARTTLPVRRVARFQIAGGELRVENPKITTRVPTTRIAACVGITAHDRLDDLALAARMTALGALDALSRVLRALSAVEILRTTSLKEQP